MKLPTKLVFTGSVGSGKSTAIGAISEIPPIRTEVPISDYVSSEKTTTTVALDYGEVRLGGAQRILIFGTPGQRRFDFMCRVLARSAAGVVILIDHKRDGAVEELLYYLDLVRPPGSDTPAVVGVTHCEGMGESELEAYCEALTRIGVRIPVMPVDARRRAHILVLLHALVALTEVAEPEKG